MITINTEKDKYFKSLSDDEKLEFVVNFSNRISNDKIHVETLVSKQDMSLFELFFNKGFCKISDNKNKKSIIFPNGNMISYIKTKKN